jgi:uncharacterized surface protein with fasciclin (FAS1) repeats
MKSFKSVLASAVAAAVLVTGTSLSFADGMPSAMAPARTAAKADIVDTAIGAGQFTTLAKALTAAGLIDTLKGPGPFTVFAPTNAAFDALPAGTVDTLLKPENKPALTKVLTYHVVAGKMDSAALMKAIDAGGGKATLTEVSGGTLTASRSGTLIMLSDESGGMAHVTIPDVVQSNGVIHVVDKVLLPK